MNLFRDLTLSDETPVWVPPSLEYDDVFVRRVPSDEVAASKEGDRYHVRLKEPDPQSEDSDSDNEGPTVLRNKITIRTRKYKAKNSDELYECIQDHGKRLNFMVNHKMFGVGRTHIPLLIPPKKNIKLNVTQIGEYVDSVEEVPLTEFHNYPVNVIVKHDDDNMFTPFTGEFKMIGRSNSAKVQNIVNAHFGLLEFVLPGGQKARIKMPMYAGANSMWQKYIPPNTNLYLTIHQ